jgi:RNA polymerase sigma factor (sigma-70 family)
LVQHVDGVMTGTPMEVELLKLLDEPVILLDPEGRYVFVNPAACQLKGIRQDDLIGRRIWDVFPEALGSTLLSRCADAVAASAPSSFEAFYQPLESWFEVHLYPSSSGIWIVFRDVTPRKNAELALADSERRFRQLFEEVPVSLYRTATDGVLLDVNPALISMLKYPDMTAFMSVNAADVYVDPNDRKRWQALLESDPQRAVFEMRDHCYDGSIIWVRDTASAVRDSQGNTLYYLGTLEDITERREAEEALRESEARFRLLATASDDVIWDWDIVSGEVLWNAALKNVFGFEPEDIGPGIEHSYAWWIAHIHEDDRARVANELHAAVQADAREWVSEYRFRRLDGGYARVVDRGYIGRNASGEATRIIGSIIDLDRSVSRSRVSRPDSIPSAPDAPPVPVTSDATLVSWIARGSERAFEDLYLRHAAFVFAVAQPLLQDRGETDEVVADVFMQIWKNAKSYDIRRGTVSAWVANMTRARALERMRRADRRDRLWERNVEPSAQSQADQDNIDPALEKLLQQTLEQLPDPQRRVIELAFFSGLSHAEIARHLNQPLGTVKTRIRAGLDKLRSGLGASDTLS